MGTIPGLMWKASWLLAVLSIGCTGVVVGENADDVTGGLPDSGNVTPPVSPDGGVVVVPQASVTLNVPGEVARDHLAGDGAWVARTTLKATASSSLVTSIEWSAGGVLGVGHPPDFAIDADLRQDGERMVLAIARGQDGGEITRGMAPIKITPPTSQESCLSKLDALGVDYTVGPTANGVQRPVTVTLPLNGIVYKNSSGTVRRTHFMDCELALALWRSAELWKEQGVTAIRDYGIYNYRCIDQSVSPPCPGSSFSQHAFAMGIDLAVFEMSDGTKLSVNDDWVIDADDDPCGGMVAGAKNSLIHQLACTIYDNKVFKYILTPNYNSAHRNHFHVDLTPRESTSILKIEAGGIDVGADDE
jgi:hypothetical protein